MTRIQILNIFKKHRHAKFIETFLLSDCKEDIVLDLIALSKKGKNENKV